MVVLTSVFIIVYRFEQELVFGKKMSESFPYQITENIG